MSGIVAYSADEGQAARPLSWRRGSAVMGGSWRTRCLAALAVVGLALAAGTARAAEETAADAYQLGHGLRLGDSGFTAGGYLATHYERLRDSSARLVVSNASLFLWWEGEGRWKFFSELDLEHAIATRSSPLPGKQAYLALERFYFDYALGDAASLRLGKYLTPIGRWNLIHADPLVWTTSRPLTTEAAFPTNATGLMVSGSLPAFGQGIDYSLYGSWGQEIRNSPDADPFREAHGLHLNLPLAANTQLGFSLASFEQESARGDRKRLLGLDFLWSWRRFELSAEGIRRRSSTGAGEERGGFLQGVAPLSERLYAVARYESFHLAGGGAPMHLRVVGLNYRPRPAVSLKAEWLRGADRRADLADGVLCSVNLLF